jgi:hypothetical protein
MPPKAKPESNGESSTAVAKAISSANGTATYELPWYAHNSLYRFGTWLTGSDW